MGECDVSLMNQNGILSINKNHFDYTEIIWNPYETAFLEVKMIKTYLQGKVVRKIKTDESFVITLDPCECCA
jgi:hypothetical protein